MSDIAFGAVRSSGGRTLPKRDRTTPVLRSAATGLCTGLGAIAAIGIVGASALAAAGWIVSVTIGGNPRIHTEAPMGPRRLALADTEFKMAGPAPSAKMLIAEVLAAAEKNSPPAAEPPLRIARIETQPLPRIARADAIPLPQARPAIAAPQIALAAPVPSPILEKREPKVALNAAPPPELNSKTAVYDISARTVFLPNGKKLEAHSGLGDKMDDPRFVKVRMRGATPPNVYDLKLREALFHGVRAIRLNPVNESAMFGRDGMLAHTYMLGPNGQSNGCVSFKDYDKFLQAFLDGQVDRLVVVPSLGNTPYHVVSARHRRDVKYAANQ